MIRTLFLALIAVFFMAAPRGAFGQDAAPGTAQGATRISPDEAVELAVKNNLGLEQKRISVSTKQRASAYSWNKFVPTVNLSGGANINSSAADVSGDFATPSITKQSQTSASTAFQGQAQVQLAINFALFEAVNYLKMDYESGRLSLEQAKLQMERDVRKSYFNIMLLEEQVKQLKESQRNAEEQAVSAETQYRAGRQPELSYLQARVNVETMKPSIDQAVNGLRLAKSNFAMTLGLPLDTDFELFLPVESIKYFPLDMEDLVRQAKGNNPDIQVQKQQLRTLQSQRKAQVYQKWTPNLSIGWSGGFSSNDSDTGVDTNLGKTKQKQSTASTNSSITLGLSWMVSSLLPFGPDAQSIKDLDDNVKTLSIALAQAEQGSELDITNKVYSLEQIRSNIEAQRATAQLAERSYNETLRAYSNGLQSLLQAQNADLQLRNARLNLYQQESNYLQGLIDLEYSIGAPFGSLMTRAE
ncbi:MAG: TolC family protein [Spirochaetaceae bacterium]|jgi:outer membrane protein TolC|nr:TolC family protein [Spirochaetaceae bacterium]